MGDAFSVPFILSCGKLLPYEQATCTEASGVNQAVRTSRACSQDICYVQYFNLSWIFFIHKKGRFLGRKRICTYEKSSSSTKTPIWLHIIFVAEIWPTKRDVT